jgi:hypothetical protein
MNHPTARFCGDPSMLHSLKDVLKPSFFPGESLLFAPSRRIALQLGVGHDVVSIAQTRQSQTTKVRSIGIDR